MEKAKKVFNNVRLALFPIGYGMVGALVGGTLNRVFIADIGLAASLVGFVFAIQYLVSPVRVWLGYRSDGFPIFGKKRESYMVLGTLVLAIGISLAAFLAVRSLEPRSPWPYVNIGDLYAAEGRAEEAILWYEWALVVAPRDPGLQRSVAAAHVEHGTQLLQAQLWDQAEIAFRRALEIDPRNVHAQWRLDTLTEPP